MNITEPTSIKAYNYINDHLLEAYLTTTDNSMSQAATEISKKQKESTSVPGEDNLANCMFPLMGHGKNEGMIP